MRALLVVGLIVVSATASTSQEQPASEGGFGGAILTQGMEAAPNHFWADVKNVPDYGYVMYGSGGDALKAWGPNTPVQTRPDGSIFIPGTPLPEGAVIRTEDSPTYLGALEALWTQQETVQGQTEHEKSFREIVSAISEGATMVQRDLCNHPARPSAIKVEMEGGFSFAFHGKFVGTVDWNLDTICAASSQ